MKLQSFKFLWLLVAVMSVIEGYGCSCNMPLTIKESVDRSPTIFVGTVLAESTADLGTGLKRAYMIGIKKVFKGHVRTDTVVVLTNFTEASCGIQFKLHSKIVVFAGISLKGDKPTNEHRFFETSLCTWSGPYKESYGKQLLTVIGKT